MWYRPDVGYVQGMSYLAGMFLLSMDTQYEAFTCLSNFLNRQMHFSFFRMDRNESVVVGHFKAFQSLLAVHVPAVHKQFVAEGVTPDMYLTDWLVALYTRALPLDLTFHVWDVYLLEGEYFAFHVALGILKLYSKELVSSPFEDCLRLLNNLPPDMQDAALFKAIQAVSLTPKKYDDVMRKEGVVGMM